MVSFAGWFTASGSAMPRTSLCWIAWADQRRDLQEGEYVPGRGQHAAIALESLSVSRRHARIVISDGNAILEDLGSRNVGNHPVTAPTP